MSLSFLFSEQTHHTYGGGPISSVANILEIEAPFFGSALEQIDLTVFYPGRSKKAHASIPYEPPEKDTRRFERKRRTMRILWISRRQSEVDVGLAYLAPMTSELLMNAFDDAVDGLEFGLKRLNSSDDFDKAAFFDWLKEIKARPWGDGAELQTRLNNISQTLRAQWEAKAKVDPWSVVEVDWDEMHPAARSILNDPQDWSFSDDFSPHGNDTGADIFADWSVYKTLTAEQAATQIGWGPEFDLANDLCWKDWVEINLALPFGHIKKTGTCPVDFAARALAVLREDLAKTATLTDWEHREDYTLRLSRYCDILEKLT